MEFLASATSSNRGLDMARYLAGYKFMACFWHARANRCFDSGLLPTGAGANWHLEQILLTNFHCSTVLGHGCVPFPPYMSLNPRVHYSGYVVQMSHQTSDSVWCCFEELRSTFPSHVIPPQRIGEKRACVAEVFCNSGENFEVVCKY